MEIQSSIEVPALENVSIKFHGKPGEYFRIWIVNLALTLLTLGIYSAWAKVRTKKYLYGNTEIAGSRFDYHADPIRILKGRILVGILFLGYSLGGKISPAIAGAFSLLFAIAVPWLIVRGLIFSLSNTSFRNIRFGFKKDYRESYNTYILAGLISGFTLGLGFPYSSFLLTRFRLDRIRFGSQFFSFKGSGKDFYKIFFTTLGVTIGASALLFIFFLLIREIKGSAIIGAISIYFIFIIAPAFYRASFFNLIGMKTQLGGIRFDSRLIPLEVVWIYLSNLVACIASLGLAIPWAIVRSFKYRVEHTLILVPAGALEKISADAEAVNQSASADAAVDFWDLDLGF